MNLSRLVMISLALILGILPLAAPAAAVKILGSEVWIHSLAPGEIVIISDPWADLEASGYVLIQDAPCLYALAAPCALVPLTPPGETPRIRAIGPGVPGGIFYDIPGWPPGTYFPGSLERAPQPRPWRPHPAGRFFRAPEAPHAK